MPTVSELQVKVTADTKEAESGLAALGSKVGSVGSAIGTAFGGAAIAGIAGLAAGFTASVGAAAGFEQQMSAIKAVSGATATEMSQLSTLALDLGKSTSFSASEAAKGIEELIKAGVSVGDVMGGAASASLSLAAAGAIDVGSAAEIAANAMNQFNLKGADLGHVADLIAGAANASAIDVNDFKFSLAAVGAVANTVGFSFDDTAAAIALLGQAGIKGSDAGTSLKTMLLNLQPSTEKQTALFRELGLITADGANQFFDATGKVKSMSDVAGVLQTALAGMTQQQKLATLETIFGSDAIRAAAVFANEGSAGFDAMAASMGKVTAEAVATERLNNLAGSFEQMKGSLETLAITIGMAFLPMLKEGVDGLTGFANWLIPLAEEWAPLAAAAISEIGSQIVAAFQTAAPLISTALGLFQNLLDIFLGGDSFDAAAEVLDRVFGPQVTDMILDMLAAAGNAFRELSSFFMETFGTIVSWFQENWPLIKETVAVVLAAIAVLWEQHGGTIIRVIGDAWTIIRTTIEGALDIILSLLTIAMDLITGNWEEAWDTLVGLLERTGERLGTILGAAFDALVAIIDDATGGMITDVTTWMSETADAVTTGMQTVEQAISSGWESAKSSVSSIMPTIRDAIMSVWNALPEDIRADLVLIAGHITTQGAAWVTSVTTAGANMLSAITTALGSMVSAVTSWAGQFLAPITGLVGTASSAATSVGSGMLSAIQEKLNAIVSAVTSWGGQVAGAVSGIAGSVGSAAASIGQAIVNGITNAIGAGVGAIRQMAYQAARAALDAAKSALGIESPSKAFRKEVGRMIPAGIIAGVQDMARPLAQTISGMVPLPSTNTAAFAMAGAPSGSGGGYQTLRVDVAVGGRLAEQIYVEGREIAIRRGRVPAGSG